jgi:hypothetical protein
MTIVEIVVGFVILSVIGVYVVDWRARAGAERRIRAYMFNDVVLRKFREKYPKLEVKEVQLVARALRQFFLAYLLSGQKGVGMPSRVVDDLWHEFILDTRSYAAFCKSAFNGYFHHVPAGGILLDTSRNMQLGRTWRHACLEENINPKRPTRLPLLFAIDSKLAIAEGFTYSLSNHDFRKPKPADGCDGDCGGGACDGGGLISSMGSDSGHGGDGGHGGGDGGGDGGGCSGGCGGGCGGGD